MDESVTDHVRDLFAATPDEFVAARNALVTSLKRDDRRADAAAVARLRRPSWIDGALNRVAGEQHDVVVEFVEAARAARRIQHADAAGKRTASLPEALRIVRAAQGRLASAGNAALVELGRKADLAGVTARLGAIGADAATLDLLAAGVLGLDDDELAATFVGDDAADEATIASDLDDDAQADADGDDPAEHQSRIDAATRAARSAHKEAQVAATAARRASERRDRAIAAVEAAEAAVRDAEAMLERARSELTEHESRAVEAERAADDAAQAASDAAARLDDLLG